MAVSVSKAGPYYSSGQIKFSDLRRDFRAQQRKTTSSGSETTDSSLNSGSVSVSELLRDTDVTEQSPIVPDCTENSGISASNDWKVSQFRNSIKYYYVTLPSSDEVTNFNIGAQTWNTNLDKTINKVMFIDGICGSNIASSPAARLNATTYNLTIDVYGIIYGAGGRGGGTNDDYPITGESGGDALDIISSSENNIIVNVRSDAKIYGGGGGGEKGATGASGTSGTCTRYTSTSGCGGAPGCPSGYSQYDYSTGGCCQTYNYCCGLFNCGCVACSQYQQTRYCRQNYSVPGAPGGVGGNGGVGQGYNQTKTNGLGGSGGTSGGCPNYGGSGSTGQTGGNGGNWGSNGDNTDNTGSGGASGRAVAGSNYSVTGTINSTTVKGAYNP